MRPGLKTLLTLSPTIWLLGLISFFNDAAGEMVYSVMPLYVASVLMAGPKTLGLIEGVAEATGSLFRLLSGVLADKTRATKPWVVGGYALANLARPLLGLVSTWPLALLLRFADRVGKGLRTSPRDAMLALSAPPERRGLAFGLHRSMDNIGTVIGPLLAAWMLVRGMNLREVLMWVAVPGAITVLLTLLIREPPRERVYNPTPFDWSLRGFPPSFKRYLLVLGLFTLGNASNTFLLLRARDMGLPDYQIPMLWALVAGIAALFSTPLSALSDRIERTRLISFGWGVYGLFYLLLGINTSQTWLLWPLFAFYGLFMAATEGAERALVADFAPPERMGTAFGWFNLTTGLLLLPSSLLFGWIWETAGPTLAFGIAASFALLATALLKLWVVRDARQENQPASEL